MKRISFIDDFIKIPVQWLKRVAGNSRPGSKDAVSEAELVAHKFGEANRLALLNDMASLWEAAGSEIERMLLAHLSVMDVPAFFNWRRNYPYPRLALCLGAYSPEMQLRADEEFFGLYAQQPMLDGKYRADFLLVAKYEYSEKRSLIVIECDGHDFHERTKEQAARDRQRDRDMTAAGYKVFRFTGSEIWRDAGGCAAEVASFLTNEESAGRPGD